MTKGLVVLGLALIVAGASTLLWILFAVPRPDLAATPVDATTADVPSLFWALLAGLTLAAGAACVGIGANRWYQYRPRTIQRPPGEVEAKR